MYKLLRSGFEAFPTTSGPNGEVILNLSRRELDRIDVVPQSVNVLILDNNYIHRLENLVNLHDLHQLSVASNKLYQMHGVAQLTNLTILNLPHNAIVAIDGLSKLTQLRWLNLSANRLKSVDQLDGNVNLKHLDVSENYISQLTDISHLRRLKTFLLHCNRIQTLVNAENLLPQSLEIFSMASNLLSDLKDVEHLTSLSNLVQFSVQNNPCTALPPDEYEPMVLSHLPRLDILNGIHVQPETRARAEKLRAAQATLASCRMSGGSTRMSSSQPIPRFPQSPPATAHSPISSSAGITPEALQMPAYTRDSPKYSVQLPQRFGVIDPTVPPSITSGKIDQNPSFPHVSPNPTQTCHGLGVFDDDANILANARVPSVPAVPMNGSDAPFPYCLFSSNHPMDSISSNRSSTVASSLLMSESVYLPMNAPPVPQPASSPPADMSFSRRSKSPELRSSNATHPLTSDSLDSVCSHDLLASDRTPVNMDASLRRTLQASDGTIPLNQSSSFPGPLDWTGSEVNGISPPVQKHLIDGVHMLNDEEDNEDQYSSQHASHLFHVGSVPPENQSGPLSAMFGEAPNVTQLIQRSCQPRADIFSHSLDSWMGTGAAHPLARFQMPPSNSYDSAMSSQCTHSTIPLCTPCCQPSGAKPVLSSPPSTRPEKSPPDYEVSTTPTRVQSCVEPCPTCEAQQGTIQQLCSHIAYLGAQLKAQSEAAQAESKLRQLHSDAIEFLLNEVKQLKLWKESFGEKPTPFMSPGLNTDGNAAMGDTPREEGPGNGRRRKTFEIQQSVEPQSKVIVLPDENSVALSSRQRAVIKVYASDNDDQEDQCPSPLSTFDQTYTRATRKLEAYVISPGKSVSNEATRFCDPESPPTTPCSTKRDDCCFNREDSPSVEPDSLSETIP